MLLSASGHIKLTDFGLSEINHKITLMDILPTPKLLSRTRESMISQKSVEIRNSANAGNVCLSHTSDYNTETRSALSSVCSTTGDDCVFEDVSTSVISELNSISNNFGSKLTENLSYRKETLLMQSNFNNYHRTPGQILSLTSNIEFSPYYLSNLDASPEYGRKSSVYETNSNFNVVSFIKNGRNQTNIQNKSITNNHQHRHNPNCKHVCLYKNKTGHNHNHQSYCSKRNRVHTISQNNNDDSLTTVRTSHQGMDQKELNESKLRRSNHHSSTASNYHNQYSAAIDVCQRRQTPLRWSKKLIKRKSLLNKCIALNTNKSALFKPLIKGFLFNFNFFVGLCYVLRYKYINFLVFFLPQIKKHKFFTTLDWCVITILHWCM